MLTVGECSWLGGLWEGHWVEEYLVGVFDGNHYGGVTYSSLVVGVIGVHCWGSLAGGSLSRGPWYRSLGTLVKGSLVESHLSSRSFWLLAGIP